MHDVEESCFGFRVLDDDGDAKTVQSHYSKSGVF